MNVLFDDCKIQEARTNTKINLFFKHVRKVEVQMPQAVIIQPVHKNKWLFSLPDIVVPSYIFYNARTTHCNHTKFLSIIILLDSDERKTVKEGNIEINIVTNTFLVFN